MHLPDGFRRNAEALHPDFVDGGAAGRHAVYEREGRDVHGNFRAAADHGHLADAAELVDARHAAKNGVVADLDVPGQGGGVAHDDVVA